jgi:hypothetical protein
MGLITKVRIWIGLLCILVSDIHELGYIYLPRPVGKSSYRNVLVHIYLQ